MGLRAATVEDVRDALTQVTRRPVRHLSTPYILRVKSLLGYAHELGFSPSTPASRSKCAPPGQSRRHPGQAHHHRSRRSAWPGGAARTRRDRILIEVTYAGGLRVSELVA